MLEFLYEDPDLVAINKPSGLLVHRSLIDKHETQFAVQMVRDALGQRVYPLHRLDKPTSGVLLFAKHPAMARAMMPVFAGHQIDKGYLAVVRGFTQERGEIDYPLREEPDDMTDAAADSGKDAQEAVTLFQRLATVELPHAVGRYTTARYSLLRVTPRTGRRHQIRRHLKHIFHPVLGDTTHGDGKQNQLLREHYACHRLLLHAASLGFDHPLSGRHIEIRAGLDATFSHIMESFGWRGVIALT